MKAKGSSSVSHSFFNPLNTELNPICQLLALFGAHPFLHVSRIRVNLGSGRGWVVNVTPGAPLPPAKTQVPHTRRLGGPQSWSAWVRQISTPPEFDPRNVKPVARCHTFHGKVNEFREKPVPVLLCVLDGPGIESNWGEIFCTRPDRPCGHPTSSEVDTVSHSRGWSGCGVDLTNPLRLASSLEKKSRAILLLRLWAFRSCCRLTFTFTSSSACSRHYFSTSPPHPIFVHAQQKHKRNFQQKGCYFQTFIVSLLRNSS